ncbi:MAG: hypothetical protein IKA10_07790 [Oscillospiraceae bacterium]|nr:hypothetical protein [Oscillospiraceae bacterium]
MAKNNKTVKLYTKDTVVATSSKGNQEKWYNAENDSWYKLDKVGFEAMAEAVASEILIKHSNIETELGYRVVPYFIETVDVHRKERIACASPNFLADGQSIQTAYHILKRVLGADYQNILAQESTIQKRLALIVDTVEKSTGLTGFGKYLTLLFEVDALIANEDRHLNNIAVLEHNGSYDYCPVFDNGEGFMLDNIKYPFDISTLSMTKNLRAKPFECRFGKLLTVARELYGPQLNFNFDKTDIEKIVDKHLHWYQPFFRYLIKDRIVCVVMGQKKKYFV